jgi:cytochrome c-type biogenesis protein CcmE|tara:strand:- start:3644 stop:4060 length:417 start_codon:yes stop_codon:yes gene_type:complete
MVKKVKLRILFLLAIILSAILSVFLILKSLEKDVVFFLSPTDVKVLKTIDTKKIRVGGMVKDKSISISSEKINFVITDFKNEISVSYSGSVPNLFAENKGVVAEGFLEDRNYFKAVKILAKHDENYMPPEVKEALGEK